MTIRACTVVLLLVCVHVFAAEPSSGPIIEGYGPVLKSLLSDSAYRTRFGIENPNTELLDKLASAGVRFYVCGQSMAFGGVVKEELSDKAKVALSAMTMLTVLQSDGYALLR